MKLPLPGHVLSNDEIRTAFDVGNMGGMRKSNKNNLLLLVSDHSKSLYDDRWEGNILHYTGMGKVGDQTLASQNRTVYESTNTDIKLYLCEVFETNRYIYVGQVQLANSPYNEIQVDDEGQERQVFMFPLQLVDQAKRPTPNNTQLSKLQVTKEKLLKEKPLEELRKRAKTASKKPQRRQTSSEQIVRDPAIAAYVKKAANGICDLCSKPAPFETKSGPYLESHHVIPLADGGDDCISNAVALCPNCHRKMHSLNLALDKVMLSKKIAIRDD